MATAVRFDSAQDTTQLPIIVRGAITLGLIESAVVLAVSLVNRHIDAFNVNRALTGVLVAIGASMVIFLPGRWTRARTIEGIAGAAGIGLGAAFIFLIVDVSILQNIHTYTNRWAEVGGGSNWWYHPVWWMTGTFLPWMGAWILANQTRKSGSSSTPAALVLVAVVTLVVGALAVRLHFPGAGWNVPTFGVAILPGVALANIVNGFGASRP